jgi:predicted ribosome quality control (RQC) complex YloA/Tae2 family protein
MSSAHTLKATFAQVLEIMVFYFTSICGGEFTIYMGKDKYENEDLIKYGLPEDVWFHVDNLSSAHVYLRMKPGMTLDDISEDLLLQCCALVKANSIAGCKVRFTEFPVF